MIATCFSHMTATFAVTCLKEFATKEPREFATQDRAKFATHSWIEIASKILVINNIKCFVFEWEVNAHWFISAFRRNGCNPFENYFGDIIYLNVVVAATSKKLVVQNHGPDVLVGVKSLELSVQLSSCTCTITKSATSVKIYIYIENCSLFLMVVCCTQPRDLVSYLKTSTLWTEASHHISNDKKSAKDLNALEQVVQKLPYLHK